MLFHFFQPKVLSTQRGRKKIAPYFFLACVYDFLIYLSQYHSFHTQIRHRFSFHMHSNTFFRKTIFPFWLNWRINIQNTLSSVAFTHRQCVPFLENSSVHFYSIIRLNNLYGQCHLNVLCIQHHFYSAWFSCILSSLRLIFVVQI